MQLINTYRLNLLRLWLASSLLLTFCLANAQIIKINRICRDGNNNSVSFKLSSHSCSYQFNVALYGRENDLSPFIFIDSIGSLINYQHLNANVPSNKNWSYFLIGKINCNNTVEDYISDTIEVDTKAPTLTQIDSVSVIPGTNTVIIGWRKNNDPDFSHFSIFNYNRVDPRLSETHYELFIRDSLSGDVNTTQLLYEITTVDSCGNRAAFGNAQHGTIVLSAIADTCKNQINLNWIGYRGWRGIKNYTIFKSKNNGLFMPVVTLPGNLLSYQDNDVITPNDYTYFIRAEKDTNILVTSSSNSITTNVGRRTPNEKIKLTQVTVVNNGIEISIEKGANSNYGDIILLKKNIAGIYEPQTSFGLQTQITRNDNILEINYYKVVAQNVCNFPEDTTEASNNIVLSLIETNNIELIWNKYFTWNNGVKEYVIYRATGTNKNSAVNFTEINRATTISANDMPFINEISCYYIVAIEEGGNGKSKSNTVCNERTGEIYFPNAIRPAGNKRFTFVGIGINLKEIKFYVYNRYGQLVFETTDLTDGWNGTNNLGENLPIDVYFFKAEIRKNNGSVENKKGTITILR